MIVILLIPGGTEKKSCFFSNHLLTNWLHLLGSGEGKTHSVKICCLLGMICGENMGQLRIQTLLFQKKAGMTSVSVWIISETICYWC